MFRIKQDEEEPEFDINEITSEVRAYTDGGFKITIRKPRELPFTDFWHTTKYYRKERSDVRTFNVKTELGAKIKERRMMDKAKAELISYMKRKKKAEAFNERRS